MKFLLLIVKNMRRNLVRSLLTALGTMVLVLVFTLIWSILSFLDQVTAEKSHDLKAFVTERWQIPSQMPIAYAASIADGAASKPGDLHPADSMTWQFYVGTIDPQKRTRENMFFAFAMEPEKMGTMMDELEIKNLPADKADQVKDLVARLKAKKHGVVIGRDKLKQLNKRVGERMTVTGMSYKNVNLEFEILGTFPDGRYNLSAVMNRDYLNDELDAYPKSHAGQRHPLIDKSLNLVWLRVPEMTSFNTIQQQIMSSPLYSQPAVKCETASSGIATFLESYRDLIWGMRWLMAPAILMTLSLVIANAISISVRERRLEFAVLRVLGYRPRQILMLVVGEAVSLGAIAGLVSSVLTFVFVDYVVGGVSIPIGFFGAFFVPAEAIGWGVGVGVLTALLGSIVPAWSASAIRVTEAFAKVA